MTDLLAQLQQLLGLLKANLPLALKITSLIWATFFVSFLTGYRLNFLGIHPRSFWGIPGIACAPLLHRDFSHLLFNSIPLLVLIDFLLINGFTPWLHLTLTILVISGTALWLFGRPGIHIGASSLVMGYFGYLLAQAYQQPSLSTILLALIACYYFGSLLLGLFPQSARVSWEGHLFGFIAGILAVFYRF